MANKILLVEPAFPTNKKSKNHSQSLPIGLLKLASYHRSLGDEVKLVRGCAQIDHEPDKILMTSLFTYWSSVTVAQPGTRCSLGHKTEL